MARLFDRLSSRAALVEIARDFHARGWMAGTAGNLSAKDDAESFWITASGLPKGRLEESDFLLVGCTDGEILECAGREHKPSAETAIHRVIYELFSEARACLHVHSIDACLATEHLPIDATSLPLPALEMIKGLGIWEQKPEISLPLFENLLNVADIAAAIAARFTAAAPSVPALLVRGHGVTVWGNNLQEAYNRVEIIEFLLEYSARDRVGSAG